MGPIACFVEGGRLGEKSGYAFCLSGLLFLSLGSLRWLFSPDQKLGIREAIISVLSIWLLSCIGGALPLYFGGMFDHFIDSLFEATSALTTTGSTVLPISYPLDCPRSLIYWRFLMSGIGGMGIVLLFIVFLPALGAHGRLLFRYEATGPNFTPIYPTVRQSAMAFLFLYIGACLACCLTLHIVHPSISIFESTALAFSTISTSGFVPIDGGIAAYHSQSIETVLMIFMIIGGGSFALYFDLLRGRFKRIFDPEFLAYIAIIICLCVFSSFLLLHTSIPNEMAVYSPWQSLRYSSFNLISSLTSTGFTLQNYDYWPQSLLMLMFIAMYFGGMSGSTAGGIKIIRLQMLWECLKHSVHTLFDPDRIRVMRIGGVEIPQATIFGVLSFFLVVVVSAVVGIIILLVSGVDWITATGLSGAMLNNAGITFGAAGASSTCADLPITAKIVSIIWMLLGRLEYYLWLTLLLPSFWRR